MDIYESYETEFQFHTGSIKREMQRNSHNKRLKKFQFHTGSIKRKWCYYCDHNDSTVSIPYWFD